MALVDNEHNEKALLGRNKFEISDIADALGHLSKISRLDLSGLIMGTSGASKLAKATKAVNPTQDLTPNESRERSGGFFQGINLWCKCIGGNHQAPLSRQTEGKEMQPRAALTSLVDLDLSLCDLKDGLEPLKELLISNPLLERLELSGCKIPATATVHLVSILKNMPSMTDLGLGTLPIALDTEKNSLNAGKLAECLQHMPSLKRLNLSKIKLSSSDVTALAPVFTKLASLTSLNLGGCLLGQQGASTLASALQTLQLVTHLDISGCNIGNAFASSMSPVLQAMSKIKYLDLSNNNLDTTAVASLKDILHDGITSLNISKNSSMGRAGLDDLAQLLKRMKSMSSLDLSELKMDYLSAAEIAKVLEGMSALRSLALRDLKLDTTSATAISKAFTSLMSVTSLNLSELKMDQPAAAAIAPGLACMIAMATLDLSEIKLDSVCSETLATGLNNMTAMTSLNLSKNSLVAERVVAPVLKRMTLMKSLNLSNNQMNKTALEQLPLAAMTSLTFLDLRNKQSYTTELQALIMEKVPPAAVVWFGQAGADTRVPTNPENGKPAEGGGNADANDNNADPGSADNQPGADGSTDADQGHTVPVSTDKQPGADLVPAPVAGLGPAKAPSPSSRP
mmetsp:Transcript_14739/g.40217  ORF Transcript_14739/g.40217 Transcript_14739/m.40217 type:complete len:625 (+) Transcript_14739:6266-8140(+)